MHHATAILLLTLVTPLLAACPLKPEVIGDTLTTSSSATDSGTATDSATDSDSTDGSTTVIEQTSTGLPESTTASFPTNTTDAPPPADYGDPCEFMPNTPSVTVAQANSICTGGLCVLIHDEPLHCDDNQVCMESPDHSYCKGGSCALSPEYIYHNAHCSQLCETVDECPPMPGCSQVFCGVVARLGEFCCEKMCGCLDGTTEGTIEQYAQECEDGVFCH